MTEMALREEGLYERLLDSAPDATIVIDSTGKIIIANLQCERIFGYPRTELVGQHLEVLVPERFRPRHTNLRNAFIDKPTARPMGGESTELFGRRKDGTEFPVEISLSPVPTKAGMLVAASVRDITARKKIERAAQELASIVDSSTDAILGATPDGTITSWNASAERIFGWSAEEVIGKPNEMLIPKGVLEQERELIAKVLKGERVEPFETVRDRKDGRRLDISMSMSPIRDRRGTIIGVSKIARDITEKKRIEAAVKQVSDRLASAVESIQGALAIFDGADRLVLCNSEGRVLFGAQDDILGKTFGALLDGAIAAGTFGSAEEPADALRSRWLAYHHEPTGTLDVRTADGRTLRVTERRTPEGGTVVTIWDLTEDVEREAEIRRARAAAETASAAKSEFLASMSHELRTPLNAILGFAQLLQRDKKTPLSERQQERVTHVLKAGEHLLRLIDEVLDLARIEAGRLTVSLEPVDVLEVLDEVEMTLKPLAERHGITLRVERPETVPKIIADRTRFAQVLMNFGSNAIKYGRAGGHLDFLVKVSGERVRIVAKDDGMGIPVSKQDKIFQPFQRAGQEAGPIEGTGIGLTISKRLAEVMGGTVGFTSREGEGSEFWIELGVAGATAARSAEAPGAKSANDGLSAATGPRHLVLYIEDNPSNIALMEDMLADFERIQLVTAPTAELGIEIARARLPALVIMDINLPGMSGVEATRRLREWPETQKIPIVALTAAAMARDTAVIAQSGVQKVLTKPVKVDELMGVLEKFLEQK